MLMRYNPELANDTCVRHDRHGLWRLPDLHQPPTVCDDYQLKNDFIVLMPMFENRWGAYGHKEIRQCFARAAMWGRNTWLEHSDANDYGVKVALYIEDVLEPELRPTLERNFVDWERDVITWNREALSWTSDAWAGSGPIMMSCWDPQLAQYEYILNVNVDLWVGAPNGNRMKVFECLHGVPDDCKKNLMFIVSNSKRLKDVIPEGPTLRQSPVFREYSNFFSARTETHGHNHDESENWEYSERVFEQLGCADFLDSPVQSTVEIHGSLWGFPARHFHENRPADMEFIKKAAPLLGSDETVMSIIATRTGEPIESLMEWMDTKLLHLNADTHLVNDETLGTLGKLKQLDNLGKPYFSHREFNSLAEHIFYKHMGIE